MDREAWRAVIHGVTKSRTNLSLGQIYLWAKFISGPKIFGPFFDWVIYFSGIELQELLIYF